MKNAKLLILSSILTIFLTSCGSSSNTHLSREEDSDEDTSVTSTTSTDVSEGSGNTSTSEEKTPLVSDLTEENYKSFITYYNAKFASLTSFKAVTEGHTLSNVFGIDIDQSIAVKTIKSKDYAYMMNESHSSLVNTTHEVFYHDKKALYKDNGESNYHLKDMKSYLNKYGTYPLDKGIEGYIIKDETITSISKKMEGDIHVFTLGLDPEKSSTNVRIQMKQFGGLDDYPIFSEINLTIKLQNDYTPISVSLDSKYVAKKMLDSSCHQTYTNTYSNINEELTIEHLDEVKDLFNGEVEVN